MSNGSTLSQLLALETKRAFSNQFHVKIKDISSTDYIQNFHFYATKISFGAYSLDVERIISSQRTLLKKATIPDIITITIKETHDWDTLNYFYTWYTKNYYNPATKLFRTGSAGKRKTFEISALRPTEQSPYSINLTGDEAQATGLKIIVKDALLVSSISLPSFGVDESNPIEHSFSIQSDSIDLVFGEKTIL